MSPPSASYLGVPGYAIFWVLFAIAFSLFAHRVYLLIRLMLLGQKENRFDSIGYRIIYMLVATFGQWCNLKNVSRKDRAGIAHAFMFWGFGLFLIGYFIFIGVRGGFGFSTLFVDGSFEKVYFSILDIAGLFVVTALIWAAIRRYIIKPERLKGQITAEAGVILLLVFSLMVFHFCVEGFDYAARDASVSWPPIGGAFASFLIDRGIAQGTLESVFKGFWWLHYAIILSFLVFIPRSKHLHILASFPNVAFKSSSPKGALKPVDLEKPETFGASKIQDFSWKQLLDLYACTVCGRCHAICPAQLSGKPLSPRELILNLKEHLLEVGPELLKVRGEAEASSANPGKALIGEVVTEDEIWACTTCRACQEVCPAYNEHIDKIIDLRRNLAMVSMSETVRDPLKNLRVRGHPWRGTTLARTDWAEGLDIKTLAEYDDVDLLYWVGCTEALEDRSIKVAQAVAKLLKLAGVNFGILGDEEICCGDPARRMGGDHIFQLQAQTNIELLQSYNVKKIVTACPHCFNTLKNEYPQFGGEFEVIHHTQFIADLIKQGRLKLTTGLEQTITYHDACYLGRHNDIYETPREVVKGIPQAKMVEMERNRKGSFCCGGGGGRMWLEERIGKRISEMRIDQVIEVKAQIVATACPYCLQMFEDAIKAKAAQESLTVMDIAEIVEGSVVH